MTDVWKWPATLFGGPLDGQIVATEGCPDVLRLAVPPGPPRLDSYGSDDLSGPAVATYELIEREYLDVTGAKAFMHGLPDHPVVRGKYRWKP